MRSSHSELGLPVLRVVGECFETILVCVEGLKSNKRCIEKTCDTCDISFTRVCPGDLRQRL